MNACTIAERRCQPCEGGVPPLTELAADELLRQLPGWQRLEQRIEKRFEFRNHHELMAFLNAIAWVSEREGHHPDVRYAYRDCTVAYTTHAIAGLSENDFICAGKVERLLAL